MQRKEEKKTNLFSLEGKNAVVTGCATGIGQGLAVGLAKAGAKILAFDIADLSETKQKVEEVGGECQLYHVDLSNSAMIDEVWHLAVEENQHIDILFNNAGMQHRESVLTYPEDVFDREKAFIDEHLCRVVSGYTCSKGGMLSLTRALSNELAPYGICVNALAPGYILTELTRAVYNNPEKSRPINERIPMGRWGNPDDFEGIAVFLASQASDYITGAMIPVDGGYTAR